MENVKLGKTVTDTYNLSKEVYGVEWFQRFPDGRGDVEDDCTSKADNNKKRP